MLRYIQSKFRYALCFLFTGTEGLILAEMLEDVRGIRRFVAFSAIDLFEQATPRRICSGGAFFVGVALTARIEDALLLQRRITAVTNNDVVEHRDLDELGRFDEVLRGADVLIARCGRTTRMIVNKDN
jgi:hypothetical protein